MSHRGPRWIISLFVAVALIGAPTLAGTASAATAPTYLFVVDSPQVTIKPGNGDFARVVVRTPRTTAFTDRPDREASRVPTVAMLEAFGWQRDQRRFRHYPNAALSIDGRSHVVEIRRAAKTPGRVVLWVRGLAGPLERLSGAGSVFIDNAPQGYDIPTPVMQFPQFDYALFALAGPRDQVTITVVSGAVLSPDGTWSGGTTVDSITISPEQPTGSLSWSTANGESTWDVDFSLAPAQDGVRVNVSGSQTFDGGTIPILGQSTFVPSYWCASTGSC